MYFQTSSVLFASTLIAVAQAAPAMILTVRGDDTRIFGPNTFCIGLSPGGGESCFQVPERCFVNRPIDNTIPTPLCEEGADAPLISLPSRRDTAPFASDDSDSNPSAPAVDTTSNGSASDDSDSNPSAPDDNTDSNGSAPDNSDSNDIGPVGPGGNDVGPVDDGGNGVVPIEGSTPIVPIEGDTPIVPIEGATPIVPIF